MLPINSKVANQIQKMSLMAYRYSKIVQSGKGPFLTCYVLSASV